MGGSFAASLTTWIWIRRADQHHAYLTESITPFDPATREALTNLGGAGAKAYTQLEQTVISQAYIMSTVDYFTPVGLDVHGFDTDCVASQAAVYCQGGACFGRALTSQDRSLRQLLQRHVYTL